MKPILPTTTKVLFVLFSLLIVNPAARAEGSKQANANGGPQIQLEIGRGLAGENLGPFFGSEATQRIYVTLANANEAIYFGFDEDGSDSLWVRIMDSNGNKVWPAGTSWEIPSSGAGYISGQTQANNGPNYPTGAAAQAAGYTPQIFAPGAAGDYYFEFNDNSGTSWNGAFGSRGELLALWDFTVINTSTHTIQEGRLWNRSWTLRNDDGWGTAFSNETFIYTADGTVTKFWGEEFNPFAWNTFANSTGTQNTGDIESDRKSRDGYAGTPEHKLFWNEPDINVFPNGTMPTVSTESPVIEGCLGDYCVLAKFDAAGGLGRILLDLDGPDGVYTPGTADVLLEELVPTVGWHCFNWDGKDGLGATVTSSISINMSVDIIAGVTHFPTFDTECNLEGYKVQRVRPQTNVPTLFWDDSLVPDPDGENPDPVNLDGCIPDLTPGQLGCHIWTSCTNNSGGNNSYGDSETINTWWYSYIESRNFTSIPFSSTIGITSLTASSPVSCNGQADGQLTVTVSSTFPPYTFLWSTGASYQGPLTSQTLTGLSAGTYTITASDNEGCVSINSLTLNDPPVFVPLSSQVNVAVFGGNTGSATLTASGGTAPYIYAWSTGATVNEITGLTAGSYSGTVSDQNGCKDITAFTITQNAQLVAGIDAQSPTSSCGASDGSATLSASGGDGAYTFTYPGGSTANPNTGLAAGTYQVTATDGVGAKALVDVTIVDPAGPSSTAGVNSDYNGADISCHNTSDATIGVTPSGGTPGYTYLWSNNATTQTVANVGAGQYQVTVTDASGCVTYDAVTVTAPTSITSGASVTSDYNGAQLSCATATDGQATATASGGTGALTYLWSNGNNTAIATGLSAGQHTVTVSDLNGCTSVSSVSISAPTALSVANTDASDYNGSGVSCNGATDGTLGISASGGTGAYSYSWTGPSGYTSASQDISGLAAGAYNVTVSDANSCQVTDAFTITSPTALTIANTDQSDFNGEGVSCNGANDGTAGITASGGTPGYSYSWTGPSSYTSTSQNISSLAPGVYNVTVSDQNGCAVNQGFTITEPVALTVASTDASDYNGSGLTCNGANDGTLGVTASGGTGAYGYSWSGPSGYTSTNQNISGLTAGAYSVSITDENSCQVTQGFTLTQPDALSGAATATSDYSGFNVSTNGGSDGTATVTVAGGTPAYTYAWPNGQNIQNATGLSATTYIVTVTDQNGCIIERSVTLDEPGSLEAGTSVTSDYNGAQISCFGASDGTATVTVSGGATPYIYLWSNGATLANTTGLSAGTASVTVTDNNGITAVRTVTLANPTVMGSSASVTSDFNGSDVSCNGASDGSASVTGSGGTGAYSYLWSTNATTQSISNISAGAYSVTVSDVNGCTSATSVTLNDPVQISVAATATSDYNGSQISCNGANDGTIGVSASGGTGAYGYSWSGPSGYNSTNQNISGLAAGAYSVSITDVNSCQVTQGFTLTQPDALSGAATATSDYSGFNVSVNGGNDGTATVTVAGGTPAYTYAWPNGQSTENATGLSATTYIVTVTDQNGCVIERSVTLDEPGSLVAGTSVTSDYNGAQISCFGASDGTATVTVSGGATPYTYLWSNGAIPANTTGLSAGTASVTITDNNGITAVRTVVLANPTIISSSASVTSDFNGSDVSCNGASDGSASVTGSGGTGAYSYLWSTNATTQSISNITAGAYSVTVSDVNGCTSVSGVTLNDPTQISAAASVTSDYNGTQISCDGASDGSASVTGSGGTGSYSYAWSTGASTQSVSGLTAGSYTVTVTDANGCAIATGVTLTAPTGITSGASVTSDFNGFQISCVGASDGAALVTASGGTGAYSYAWSNGQSTATLTGVTAGAYTVTVTDVNGCTSSTSVTLTDPTPLTNAIAVTSGFNGQDISCFGETDGEATITPSGGTGTFTYLWSNGQNTATLSGVGAGAYSVTATDQNGCTTTAAITITEPTELTIGTGVSSNYNGRDLSCNGGSDGEATVTVSGGTTNYTYLWSDGQTTALATNLAAGTYEVTVTDANGCNKTSSITLTDPPLLDVTGTQTNILCFGFTTGSIDITPVGGTVAADYLYNWSNGAITQDINGLAAGSYSVTVTDDNGCTASIGFVLTQPAMAIDISGPFTDATSGLNNGTISATVTGGTPPYTNVWNDAGLGLNRTGLAPGSYTLSVTDANGCVADYTWVIDGNDPPVAVGATFSTPEDTPITIPVTVNDYDIDSNIDPTTVNVTVQPANGTTSVDPVTGDVTYTPNLHFVGTDYFTYEVCDDGTPLPALCDTAIIEIIIGGIDDAPIAVNDTVLNLPTGDTTVVDVLVNDSDPDNDPISTFVILTPPVNGVATQIGNSVEYISTPGTSGWDSLQYVMTDGVGGFDTAWVYIDVIVTNQPPVAIDDAETTSTNTPVVVSILDNDSDPDNNLDSTSVGILDGPDFGSVVVDPVTGEITYTPTTDYVGNDTLTYYVCDTGIPVFCDTAEVVITIEPRSITVTSSSYCSNDTPYLTWDVVVDNFPNPGLVTITFADANLNPIVTYNDLPLNDTMLWPGAAVDANGNPTDWPGWIYVNGQWIQGDDGFQDTRPFSYVLFSVNPTDTLIVSYPPPTPFCASTPPTPPVAVNDSMYAPLNTSVSQFILANDTAFGANIDPGNWAVLTGPLNGNFFYDFFNGEFIYTPFFGFTGLDSLQYTVCDDHNPALCDTAWVYIDVASGNDMPTAIDDYDTTSANTPVVIDVLPNDTDPENNIDPTSVTITSPPSNGTVTVDPVTGELTYTPDLDYTGQDTLTYQVCDTGLPVLCDEAEVIITIEPRSITVNSSSYCNNDTPYITWDVTVDNFPNPGLVTVSFVDSLGNTVVTYNDLPLQDTLLWPGAAVDGNGNPTDWPGWLYVNGQWIQGSDGFETTRPWCYVLFSVNPTDTLIVSYPPPSPFCVSNPPSAPIAFNDTASTSEAFPVDIPILLNDQPGSAPFDSTSYSELTPPLNGSASFNPVTGDLTYTPDSGFVGLDSLEYQICDQNSPALCTSAWIHIDVVPNSPTPPPSNELPVAVNDTSSTPFNTPVVVVVVTNDSDPDGSIDPTSVAISNSPDNGSAAVDPVTGEITYTPNPGFVGLDSLQYTICDDGDPTECDVAWVYVTVGPPTGPIAVMDTATTSWSTPVDIDLPANDTGTSYPIDPSTVTILDGPDNGVYSLDPNTGVLTYVADSGFVGTDTITYAICDQGNPSLCDTTIAVITVEERVFVILYADSYCANNVPWITYSVSVVNFPPPPTISLIWMDSLNNIVQVDSGLPYTGVIPWAGVVLDNNGDCVDWPGWELVNGQWVPFDDGFGATAPAANLIVSVNPTDTISIPYPPAGAGCVAEPFSNPVTVNDTLGVLEDTPVDIDVLNNDIPDGAFFDSTTVTILQGPWEGTATVDPVTGVVTYVPGPNFFGPDSLQYTACDQNAVPLCDTSWVYLFFVFPVNDPPVAVDDFVGTPLNTPVVIDALNNDYDVDNDLDTSSVVVVTPPSNGVVVVDPITGLHTYTPNFGFSGIDTYAYAVCEDTVPALCDTATVTILIDPNGASLMQPPVAVNDSATTPEGVPVVIDVPNNDTDPNGNLDSTSVTILIPPGGGTAVIDTLTGEITYTPDPNTGGTDSLQYEICTNPPSPVPSQCTTAWVYIDIIPENDPPVAVNDTTFTSPGIIVGVPVLNNDYDLDGNLDPSTLTILTNPNHGTFFTDLGSGVVAYTPNYSFTGIDSLQYVICDDGTPLPSQCDTAWVYILVDGFPSAPPANDPPVAVNDTAITDIDTPVTIHLTGNDYDTDGIIVPSTLVVLSNPLNGSVVTDPSTGEATYTPNLGFVGVDSLQYTVCDESGDCDTAWAYITVEDVPNNNAPVAVVNYASTGVNTSVPIPPLFNDYDPDGLPLDTATFVITDAPNNGTAVWDPTTGLVNYTPDLNWSGWDTLTYEICDQGIPAPVQCDTAMIIIYVVPNIVPIDPPVAVNDTTTTLAGTPVSVVVTNNDSDPNNNPLTVIQELTPPTNGSTIWNGNNVVYTPNPGFSGVDSLQYVIANPSGGLDTAWVFITVDATLTALVNGYCDMDVPYFQWDATLTGLPNTTMTMSIYDANDVLIEVRTAQPLAGSSLWPGYEMLPSGVVNYPPANYRPIKVQFEVNPSTPVITVAYPPMTLACFADNRPPVAVNDTVSTLDTLPIVIDILPNDDDPEGFLDSTSVTIVTPPDSGSVVVNPDGSITYTPTPCFVGTDSLVYQVCDLWGPTQCAQATVYINVTETTPPVAICRDITLYLNEFGWAYLPPNFIDNGSYDLCGPVTASSRPDTFYCADLGVSSAVLSVTDEAGNNTLCTAVVIVADTTSPTVIGITDYTFNTVAGLCSGIANFTAPVVADGCGATLLSGPSINPGDTLAVGVHVLNYSYADASGNTVSFTQTITIVDVEPPVVVCPADTVLFITNSSGVSYTPPGATATDNCGVLSLGLTTAPAAGPLTAGTYTYGYTAVDVNGNQDSCSYTVTVVDATPPQISCPSNLVLGNNPGQCGAVVAQIPVANIVGGSSTDTLYRIDNSGLSSGDLFPVGVTTITWVAEDSFGNADTCSYTVTVNDQEAPVPSLPSNFTVSNDPGVCGAIVNYGPLVATDNCTAANDIIFNLIAGPASGDLVGVGTHVVVYQVCDLAGNCVTRNFTITVQDTEAPVLNLPSDTIVQSDPMSCAALFSFAFPTATDNCPGVVVTQTCGQNSGSTFPVGVTTQCYQAVDASGNITTGQFTVTVESSFNIDLGPDTVGCGFVQLWAPTGNKWDYQWQDSTQTPFYNVTQSGWYSVQITNGQGCVSTDSIYVDILQAQDSVDLGLVVSSLCLTDPLYTFPFQPNGTVTVTGPGVTNNVLDPAAAGLGSHNYYYNYVDGVTGCESSGSFRIDVVNCGIGIEEVRLQDVRLYPNPATHQVTVEWRLIDASDVTLRVVNTLGQMVYETTIDASSSKHQIDVSAWAAGNYTVILENRNSVERKRMVITR